MNSKQNSLNGNAQKNEVKSESLDPTNQEEEKVLDKTRMKEELKTSETQMEQESSQSSEEDSERKQKKKKTKSINKNKKQNKKKDKQLKKVHKGLQKQIREISEQDNGSYNQSLSEKEPSQTQEITSSDSQDQLQCEQNPQRDQHIEQFGSFLTSGPSQIQPMQIKSEDEVIGRSHFNQNQTQIPRFGTPIVWQSQIQQQLPQVQQVNQQNLMSVQNLNRQSSSYFQSSHPLLQIQSQLMDQNQEAFTFGTPLHNVSQSDPQLHQRQIGQQPATIQQLQQSSAVGSMFNTNQSINQTQRVETSILGHPQQQQHIQPNFNRRSLQTQPLQSLQPSQALGFTEQSIGQSSSGRARYSAQTIYSEKSGKNIKYQTNARTIKNNARTININYNYGNNPVHQDNTGTSSSQSQEEQPHQKTQIQDKGKQTLSKKRKQ